MLKIARVILLFLTPLVIGAFIFILLNLYQLIYKNINPPKYNIIIFSIDTLRPDHMGVYGYKKNTTPNIDNWAKNATIFTNAITVLPQTYPSFTALMTGLNPFNTKIISGNLDDFSSPISNNVPTLAKIFKKNGYQTAAFVSSPVLNPDITNFKNGFDSYLTYEFNNYKAENYNIITEKINNWLTENKDKHIFLWIHLMGPHDPYNPSLESKCAVDVNMCEKLQKISDEETEFKRKKYEYCQKVELPKGTMEQMITLYDGKIRDTDNQINSVFNKIAELGLNNNSIELLYGDHGEGFDHNYLFAHGNVLYNSAIKIPLIIKYPNNQSVINYNNQLVDNTDIFPTLFNLSNLPYPKEIISSFSFADSINSTLFKNTLTIAKRKITYITNNELSKFAVYDGRYKFIYSLKNSCLNNNLSEELYDLQNDSIEQYNLVYDNPKLTLYYRTILMNELAKHNLPNIDSENNLLRKDKLKEIMNRIRSLGY